MDGAVLFGGDVSLLLRKMNSWLILSLTYSPALAGKKYELKVYF
jgi:hypothetical protein